MSSTFCLATFWLSWTKNVKSYNSFTNQYDWVVNNYFKKIIIVLCSKFSNRCSISAEVLVWIGSGGCYSIATTITKPVIHKISLFVREWELSSGMGISYWSDLEFAISEIHYETKITNEYCTCFNWDEHAQKLMVRTDLSIGHLQSN